jgi:hypothetical protein
MSQMPKIKAMSVVDWLAPTASERTDDGCQTRERLDRDAISSGREPARDTLTTNRRADMRAFARNIFVKFHAPHVTNQPCAADVALVGVTISVACAAFVQARLLSMGLVAEGARP